MSVRRRLLCLVPLALGAAACAPERLLRVESEPPGALVRLDDLVIGRTPIEHHFQHYGSRRLTLYLAGYTPWSQRVELDQPWHATFPIDFFTEVLIPLGLRDVHGVSVSLTPDEDLSEVPDIEPLIERAQALRDSFTAAKEAEAAAAAEEAAAAAAAAAAAQAEDSR